ncbi:MAG: hypothetical protein V7K89_23550 [Nostoc sp.]|uniref:hypothetical protein n=1 Tax=Nostoc sp. TaxID=1180 RepID=UPI002FFBC264
MMPIALRRRSPPQASHNHTLVVRLTSKFYGGLYLVKTAKELCGYNIAGKASDRIFDSFTTAASK